MKSYLIALLISTSAAVRIQNPVMLNQQNIEQRIAEINAKDFKREQADQIVKDLHSYSQQLIGTKDEPKKAPEGVTAGDLEKLLKDYDTVASAYKGQWELSIYALEP